MNFALKRHEMRTMVIASITMLDCNRDMPWKEEDKQSASTTIPRTQSQFSIHNLSGYDARSLGYEQTWADV